MDAESRPLFIPEVANLVDVDRLVDGLTVPLATIPFQQCIVWCCDRIHRIAMQVKISLLISSHGPEFEPAGG